MISSIECRKSYIWFWNHFFGDQKEPIAYNIHHFIFFKETKELIIYSSKNNNNCISILEPKHIHNSLDFFAIECAKKITINMDLDKEYGIYRKEFKENNISLIKYTKYFHIKKSIVRFALLLK